MKYFKQIFLITFFLSFTLLFAQDYEDNDLLLKNKNCISLSAGFKANSKTVVSTNNREVNLESGFVGSISYSRWFKEEWCVEVSAGVFGVETKENDLETATKSIVPLLFGIGYYPQIMTQDLRPYVKLDGGVFIGSAVTTKLHSSETIVETVPGGRISFGLDIFLADFFKIGPAFSYYITGDFAEIVAEKNNYSGAAFELNFGFVF